MTPPYALNTAEGTANLAAVRLPTTPLVEIRLRWPSGYKSPHEREAEQVLARWLSLDRTHLVPDRPHRLTAHADDDRFGVAITCKQVDFPELFSHLATVLASTALAAERLAIFQRSDDPDHLHLRTTLGARADQEAINRLMSSTPLAAIEAALPTGHSLDNVIRAADRLRARQPLAVLVGDLDPPSAVRAAVHALSAVSPVSQPAPPVAAPARCAPAAVIHAASDGRRAACRLATLVPNWPHEDRALGDVLAAVLGDQHIGLATERLRSSLALSYDVRCTLRDVAKTRVLMTAATVAQEAEWRALSELSAIAHEVVDKPLPEALVERARQRASAARRFRHSSQAGLAADLVKAMAAGVSTEDTLEEPDRIRVTTTNQLTRFARRHLAAVPELPHEPW